MDGMKWTAAEPPAPRSAWWLFPWALSAVMAVVFAVNIGMVTVALRGFPGAAGGDGFTLSNSYDRVLANEAEQQALGWKLAVEIDPAHHPVLTLIDAAGQPLAGAAIEAMAARPLGPPETTSLAMREAAPGRYVASVSLAGGQWDVTLAAKQGEHLVRAVRRLIVR